MRYSDIYANRIYTLCKRRGIKSITKLAEMGGIKQSTLDNLMQGKVQNPGIQTIHKVALAFSMTPAEFLDFEELNAYSFESESDSEE